MCLQSDSPIGEKRREDPVSHVTQVSFMVSLVGRVVVVSHVTQHADTNLAWLPTGMGATPA